jgi:hypothetical protein
MVVAPGQRKAMTDENREDEVIGGLRAAERQRRTRALLAGAVVALLSVGAFVISFAFKDELFQPEIDIEEGEEEVIADTNDPQCRGFIANVTAVGGDYVDLEPKLDGLLGEDPEQIESLIAQLQVMRERLDAAEQKSADANLRFDNSRTEVDDWFAYIDNELSLLQKVGHERIAELKPAAEETAPDAGTVVEEGETEKSKSDKTLRERLDGATLAANEAFQKFRVWHTGGLHPCGPADEGETPWQPATDE